MKLTFSTSKNVNVNSKVLQLSNMLGSLKHMKGQDSQLLAIAKQSDDSLLKALKTSANKDVRPAIQTKRQQDIDEKIERLLIAYKKQDEIAHKKVTEMERERKLGKKNLMEKFGFSDDEEEDVVLSAAEIKKKAALLP